MLQAGAAWARMRWRGRGAGNRVSLGLAAEAAEVGVRLDRPAAFAAEHGSRSRGSVGRRQSGPIIGPRSSPSRVQQRRNQPPHPPVGLV